MNSGRKSEGEIAERAADWLARRDAGFSPVEADDYRRWLASDPRHADAVAELEATLTVLRRPRAAGCVDRVIEELQARQANRRHRRRQAASWALGGVAALVALALWSPFRRVVPESGVAESVTLRPDRQVLADGTVVELNARSEIAVNFSPARRAVTLLRGEAYFAVAKSRVPFVVLVGGVEARAVGTEFLAGQAENGPHVLVTEGRVAVASAAAPGVGAPVLVDAGTRVTAARRSDAPEISRPQSLRPDEIARALAWRDKRVEFSGTPLAHVVALFNGHNRVQLALADAGLGSLEVSGIFWTNDPEGFARALAGAFSLHARRVNGERIELHR